MEFKTKYNIGDEVWFIDRLAINTYAGDFVDDLYILYKGVIQSIDVEIFGFSAESEGKHEKYTLIAKSVCMPKEYNRYRLGKTKVCEEWIFATEEEAQEYLKEQDGARNGENESEVL